MLVLQECTNNYNIFVNDSSQVGKAVKKKTILRPGYYS